MVKPVGRKSDRSLRATWTIAVHDFSQAGLRKSCFAAFTKGNEENEAPLPSLPSVQTPLVTNAYQF